MSTDPVKGEGFISTKLTGKLKRGTRLESVQQSYNYRTADKAVFFPPHLEPESQRLLDEGSDFIMQLILFY